MDWRWPGSVRLVNVLVKNVSISLTPYLYCCCLYIYFVIDDDVVDDLAYEYNII